MSGSKGGTMERCNELCTKEATGQCALCDKLADRAGPKYLSTGGKELRGVKFLSRVADTVPAAHTRVLSQRDAEL